jgi:hypothetical protein
MLQGPEFSATPALPLALIHLSAWNKNSRKFAVASSDAPSGLGDLDQRKAHSQPVLTPQQAIPVTRICSKRLRLAT